MGREQYQLELQELKNQMTSVVELVKKNIRDSIRFLGNRDMKGAGLVIESDEQVNHKCWDIEEHCIRLIATQQPVAGDLRFIFSVLQITNEVERIGDYAKGMDSGLIDLVLVGDIDQTYLAELVKKAEDLIGRKIRYLVLATDEYKKLEEKFVREKALVVWEKP